MATELFLLLPLLVSIIVNLVQFLTTRKLVDLDKFKEVIKELKPEVDKTPNQVDDRLYDIVLKLSELMDKIVTQSAKDVS